METDAALGPRAKRRAETIEAITRVARRQLASEGPSGLSLRAIARELDMVSSNIYRYVASRDDLITALIIDAYAALADALERTEVSFAARAVTLRAWSREHPHLFALVYGTVIPGYAAPDATIAPAARVARAFADTLPVAGPGATRSESAGDRRPAADDDELSAQARRMAEATGLTERDGIWLASALATLVGLLTLEFGGHFVGTFDPADELFASRARSLEAEISDARPRPIGDPSASAAGG